MKIEVLQKTIYGRHRFYALNDTAEFIRRLTKQHSLTEKQLQDCKKNGFEIEIKTKHMEI